MSFDRNRFNEEIVKIVSVKPDKQNFNSEYSGSLFGPLCEMLDIVQVEIETIKGYKNHEFAGIGIFSLYCNPEKKKAGKLEFFSPSGSIIENAFRYYLSFEIQNYPEEKKECLEIFHNLVLQNTSHLNFFQFYDYYSNYDMRFPLHNLEYFFKKFFRIMNSPSKSEYSIAFINICGTGKMNREFGDSVVNSLVFNYYRKIEEEIGKDGILAILGGDNAVCAFHKHHIMDIVKYINGIPVEYDPEKPPVTITANCGVIQNLTEFGADRGVLDVCSNVLFEAKKTNKTKIKFYDEDFKIKTQKHSFIESIFTTALKDEEFLVYYQPKTNLKNYHIAGAEALVRWKHDNKMIFPDQFIPVIENNGSIKYLDMYMLKHVCSDLRNWMSEGKKVVQVSVNFSRSSLTIPNLADNIVSIIDSFKIPRSLIQIEVTESASDVSKENLTALVLALSEAGVSIAVDDFGTGYSSLSLIKELPWNVLKIDKSLLHGAQKDGSNEQFMFKSIISLANGIGLECIVEGVESREDVKILKESNCHMAQGYYFDKPLPKAEFETRLM